MRGCGWPDECGPVKERPSTKSWPSAGTHAQIAKAGFGSHQEEDKFMTQVPQKPLVPNNTLITKTVEEGRALAVMLARNSIHAMQGELETLKTGRAQYAHDPYGLIAASHVVAVEFATVAAANNYWR
jgi:Hexameric tyrosine-coordinated heme protein (HTHP)